MKQVKIDDILWVMQPEPYIITDDTDSSLIMVNCNAYKEFCTLNPSLNLTAWNYRLIRKWNPIYYEYWDDKEHSNFYFAETTQNISSFIDEDKTVTLQQLVLPEDIDVSAIYKLGDEVISGNTFVLEDAGQYVVTGIITDSSIYEDYEGSYIINYSKVKRNAMLSFTNSTVDVSTWIDENYSGTILTANNIPSGVDVKYYLDSSLLSSNNITLTTARNYSVTAKIQDDSIYNDTECSYIINYTKVKRDAVLSFANAVVNENVEDSTEYTGQVLLVSGAPSGVSINYYLGNTLLSNGQIEISDLEEGVNTFTIYAKLENDPVYNNAQASYTLSITMEISSYENKYFTIEPLEDGTIKFTKTDFQYSTDRGSTWNTLTKDTSLGVTTGNKVIFKKNASAINNGITSIKSTGQFNVSGNSLSLIFGDDYKNKTTAAALYEGTFRDMFSSVGNKLISAENLILPLTTVLYRGYTSMFYNCSSLQVSPILPGIILQSLCYDSMFKNCRNLSYITMLSPNYGNSFSNWVYNVSTNGTFVKAKALNSLPFGDSGIPNNWKVINYETNKEVYPLRFNKSTVNVSTYTNLNYTGTILTATSNRTIPNGLVKYYLDSSLLADNNITLTTPGVHTVLAEIVADTSIDDSSASYTINYTQEKRDITFSATWSKQPDANGYDVGDSEYCPSPTMHQSPSSPSASPSALYNILDSSDNPLFSWSAGWPNDSKLYTTAEGTYSCAVKYTISSVDANYKPTEQICKWTYTVNAAME